MVRVRPLGLGSQRAAGGCSLRPGLRKDISVSLVGSLPMQGRGSTLLVTKLTRKWGDMSRLCVRSASTNGAYPKIPLKMRPRHPPAAPFERHLQSKPGKNLSNRCMRQIGMKIALIHDILRRTYARTSGPHGSPDHQPGGDHIQPATRRGVPPL
jgi:hypothetical protein